LKQLGGHKVLSWFNSTINLIGAGQMGGAMLKGWLTMGLRAELVGVMDPNPPANMRLMLAERNIPHTNLHPFPFAMVMAVKPQMARAVMSDVKPAASPDTLIISIMAGTTIKNISDVFGSEQPIIRTIPNTPSGVGRGITAAYANEFVTFDQKNAANALLSALGPVEWVEREELIDVATAVSGSGPAYVFLMAESLAKAGIAAGLPENIAVNLARATVEGAGELLFKSPDILASKLRENVTSPNGTTHAALQVLMGENGLDRLMTEAVARATARSKELAS
jgi:pyrroline-5-carboxylate reductase